MFVAVFVLIFEDFRQMSQKYLKNSAVSFLAIDTPAIMEGDKHNAHNNCTTPIAACYDMVRDELAANKHTVIIVLSRCEHYWNERERMLEQLNKHYGALVSRLKAAGVDIIVTWVKTLGGLEFLEYVSSEDGECNKAKFVRVGDYHPENCATPLQLALSHGMKRVRDSIKPGFGLYIGFDVKALAVNASLQIAEELRTQLHAGNENTFAYLL